MSVRKAKAGWEGTLKEGTGRFSLGSGAFEGKFSFGTRMGDEAGTNPEELIGAALAGCYSMALNATLEKNGKDVESIAVDANVNFEKTDAGFTITSIDLDVNAAVKDISDEEFQQFAEDTKKNCPVSRALAATPINLSAKLGKAAA